MSEEETLAILNDYLTNTFLKHTSTKQAIRWLIRKYQEQQKEIEEKTTILLVGAEKVKQLEKEIKDLKDVQQQICNEELLTQEYVQNNYISKDKIRDKIKEYQHKLCQDIEENEVVEYENIIQVLKELLEE